MNRIAFAAAFASLVVGGAASAAPTYYATRGAFDAANTGLTFEGFEKMDATSTVTFTSPLNSTTSIAGVVSPGEIVAGISFDLTDGHDAYVAAPGQSANTTRAIGVNTPTTAGWKVSFDAPTNAFGVDAYQNFGGGGQSGSPILVTVNLYDASSSLIDSSTFSVPSGSNGFFGVSSTVGISYLTIDNRASFDVIDNIEFGAAPAVPEPSTYALMALGLAGIAGVARRRQAR